MRTGYVRTTADPETQGTNMATVLCLASYFKGGEFLRECHRMGCRVLLVTLESLRDEPWPREAVDEFRTELITIC